MRKNKKGVFLTEKQLAFASAKQPTKLWMGGRGSGKSSGGIGVNTYNSYRYLPRGKTFIAAPTYNQLLTKTLPPIERMWQEHGLKEHLPQFGQYGHYVVGKKPPREWERAFDQPRRFQNMITFYNGFSIDMISADRPDLSRGGSFDGGDIDEAQNVKKEFVHQVILPSIRGNTHKYNHPIHQQLRFYFTVPTTSKGDYLYEYEEKAKVDTLDIYWQESTIWDNTEVLGEKSILRMKRDMDPILWMVECENKRFLKPTDGFYYKFDDTFHLYTPSYEYGEGERGIVVTGAKDVISTMPFDISMDFGGYFTCMSCWQEHAHTAWCKDSFHVLENQGVDELVRAFTSKYRDHKNKRVYLYGEYRAKDKTAIGETIFDRVVRRFNEAGWQAEVCVTSSQADNHSVRYDLVNDFFAENNDALPRVRINHDTCKAVVIALNMSKVKPDFTKDKSDEKNRSFNQAHATHYTDTIDYYLVQKYGHLAYSYFLSSGRPARVGLS